MKLPRLPRALRLDLPLLLLLLALFPALAPCADGAQTSPTPTAPPSARLAFQNHSQGGDALLQFARAQTVYVDPVYGVWNLDSGLVEPLGS